MMIEMTHEIFSRAYRGRKGELDEFLGLDRHLGAVHQFDEPFPQSHGAEYGHQITDVLVSGPRQGHVHELQDVTNPGIDRVL